MDKIAFYKEEIYKRASSKLSTVPNEPEDVIPDATVEREDRKFKNLKGRVIKDKESKKKFRTLAEPVSKINQ